MIRRVVIATGLAGLLLAGIAWASMSLSQWSAPKLLASGTGGLLAPLAVDVDSSRSVAAWASTRGVFAAVAGSSGTFALPQRLSTAGPSPLAQPLLASDARGDAIVIWERPDQKLTSPTTSLPAGSLYASYRPACSAFGPPHLIAENALRAMVGMDGRGDATIAWTGGRDTASPDSINAAERASSGAYSPVSTLATGIVSLRGIAVDPAGDAVIDWWSSQGSLLTASIVAATRTGDGPFGAPLPISTAPVDSAGGSVAIDDAGQAFIAWDDLQETPKDGFQPHVVHVTSLQAGATTTGPVQTLEAPGLGALVDPIQISVDAAGDALAVWETDTHAGESLIAARMAAGHRFSGAVVVGKVHSPGGGLSGSVASAIGSGGAGIVAWGSATTGVQAALASSATSPFASPAAVAPASEDPAVPAVGIGAHARAIMLWWVPHGTRLQYAIRR